LFGKKSKAPVEEKGDKNQHEKTENKIVRGNTFIKSPISHHEEQKNNTSEHNKVTSPVMSPKGKNSNAINSQPLRVVPTLEERIQKCIKENSEELNISNLQLTSIPTNESIIENVTVLISRSNPLTSFVELEKFSSLKTLDLSKCGIDSIDNTGITKLIYLHKLDLSRNQLCVLPDEIKQLTALQILLLCRNKIEKLPESMTKLKYLTTLDLSYNNILSISNELEGLAYLQEVNLTGNLNLDTQYMMEDIARLHGLRNMCAHREVRRTLVRRSEDVRNRVLRREQQLLLAS